MDKIDFNEQFKYENGFYLTAATQRIAKFSAHLELFKRALKVDGDIVECGVFKGASLSRFVKFRSVFEGSCARKIIAFDIFGDFPEQPTHDLDTAKRLEFIKEAGSESIEMEDLKAIFERLGLYKNIQLIKGNILETVPKYKIKNESSKIAMLHIDVDLYEPTKVCLDMLYPLVVNNGIVILDDYNKFPGATKAIDDFFKGRDIRIKQLPYSDRVSYVEVA